MRDETRGVVPAGRKSNYVLAGPPGWVTDIVNGTLQASSTLVPHPDWYTTVLWKQLMGTTILGNLSVTGGRAENISISAWCGKKGEHNNGGSVVLAVVNAASVPVDIEVPSLSLTSSVAHHLEYVLTATKAMYEDRAGGAEERGGPVQSKIRVPLFAARTLNATGQSRVTLSLRCERLRAACALRQEERGPEIRPKPMTRRLRSGGADDAVHP